MFARAILVALCALAVSASPVVVRDQSIVSIPVARRVNYTGSANVLERDQARAKFLVNRASTGSEDSSAFGTLFTEPTTNSLVDYTVSIGVGSPAASCTDRFTLVSRISILMFCDRYPFGRYR